MSCGKYTSLTNITIVFISKRKYVSKLSFNQTTARPFIFVVTGTVKTTPTAIIHSTCYENQVPSTIMVIRIFD